MGRTIELRGVWRLLGSFFIPHHLFFFRGVMMMDLFRDILFPSDSLS